MQVQVLGKSPSWQDAGGACSGYLVREDDFALLLDCGSGVFGALRREFDYLELDAVLLTHLHADHFLDLFPFASALSYSPRVLGGRRVRPELHLPAGGVEFMRRVGECLEQDAPIERVFAVAEYGAGDRLRLGPLTARFCEVPHYTSTFACELRGGGRRFTFGADCAPNEELVEFARGTDLLMVESTLLEPEDGEDRGHMTAREAGQLGRRAAAARLVLTHFSDELDRERILAEASGGYGDQVTLAEDRACYSV